MQSVNNGISASGVQAVLYAAIDSNVKLAIGVPGYPINAIFTGLQGSSKIRAEWQYNEKIAYEMAVGASTCGDRAIVVSKHVGINIMSDPLIISATHGIGAGIVVIAGDDVGAKLSQNEQDSRWYGKLAEIPVFDPSTPSELYGSILNGMELSERIGAPVLIRITEPLLSAKSEISRRTLADTHRTPEKGIWDYTMYGKHQKYLKEGWSIADVEANASEMNKCTVCSPRSNEQCTVGIISSGYASSLASSVLKSYNISHLSLVNINPLPRELIDDFVSKMDYVLVCEEPSPFIEEQIRSPKVKGRLSGHLPRAGPLNEGSITIGLKTIDTHIYITDVELETMASRGYAKGLCPGCPFEPVYKAIGSLDVPVASDAGCSILTANPPFSMVDIACGLGSPVGVACGFNRKGVAMLGDFGLLHTGMQSLLNAKLHSYNVLVVLFVNGEAAMTGGQVIPDITDIVKGVFGDDCIVVDVEDKTEKEIRDQLVELLGSPVIKIYLVRGKCVK